MKLSIIIPCYNAEPYIDELIKRLIPQISDDIEIIVVDDGSKMPYISAYPQVKVIRQDNGGASAARNTGLDHATGEFIAFIDADDLVTEDYIAQIRTKLAEGYDYLFLSWRTIGNGWQANIILRSVNDKFPPDNLCVWNRIYRRDMIGNIRFNTKKLIAEDAEFIRLVEVEGKKKGVISDPIYLYRSDAPNSLSKRFIAGQLNTKRIVYYFKRVTSDMTYLIDDFKRDDAEAEVILMTEQNEIPELTKYAMVIPPRKTRATEVKGEFCGLIQIVPLPIRTQVVLWTSFAQAIGGIETFTYYFAKTMSKYYDIIVLYDTMDPAQIERVSQYVECRKNDLQRHVECDHLVVNRITDPIPANIHAKTTIQMVHGARITYADVPQDRDMIVCVSEYVKKTWTDRTVNAHVINNIMSMDKPKDVPLLLITASRLDAHDKGLKRMIDLGNLMNRQGTSFIWLCFSNKRVDNMTNGMIWMNPTLDILPWIQKADYLIQLSDEEAFCYSLVEALELGTPVITTPLDILDEIGMQDGKNGYVVPFNITDDYDTSKFLHIPEFEYKFNNAVVVKKWRKILGDKKPKHTYRPTDKPQCRIIMSYYDTVLKKNMAPGEVIRMPISRAQIVRDAGYCEIIGG